MFSSMYRSLHPFRDALLHPRRDAVLFAIRTLLASTLALAIAFALKLDSPAWSAITVWIVAQPSRGTTLAKGYYRLVGTCVGSAMAIAMIHFLSDQPWIFMIVLSAWMALCSWAANLVRYLRSYGAVLAGYTTSIVALLVFSHADRISEVARGRVVCVFLGIFVATIFSFAPGAEKNKMNLFRKLRTSLAAALDWLHAIADGQGEEQVRAAQQRLITEMAGIEEMLSYAVAESMQIRLRRRVIQKLVSSLISALSSTSALEVLLKRRPITDPDLRSSLKRLAEITARESAVLKAAADPRDAVGGAQMSELIEALHRFSQGLTSEQSGKSVIVDRLRDLAESFDSAARLFDSLGSERGRGPAEHTFTEYRDWKVANLAALRSALFVFIAGCIWLLTGWHNGPFLVMIAAVNCSLFSTRANPFASAATTAKSSVFAYVAALASFLLVFEHGTSEIWVLLAQGIWLLAGGVLIANAATNFAGTLFSVNYVMFFSPALPMHFDWLRFADIGLGYFSGAALAILSFRAIAAPTPDQRIGKVKCEILRDLLKIAAGARKSRPDFWETHMYARISHLMRLSTDSLGSSSRNIVSGLAALSLGRKLFEIQGDLREENETVQRSFTQAFETFEKEPRTTAAALRRLAERPEAEALHGRFRELAAEIEDQHDLYQLA